MAVINISRHCQLEMPGNVDDNDDDHDNDDEDDEETNAMALWMFWLSLVIIIIPDVLSDEIIQFATYYRTCNMSFSWCPGSSSTSTPSSTPSFTPSSTRGSAEASPTPSATAGSTRSAGTAGVVEKTDTYTAHLHYIDYKLYIAHCKICTAYFTLHHSPV